AQQTATSEDSALITARHAAAQGAGYRALHHCTARFSSGIPAHMIESIGSRQSGGEPVIDDVNRTVTVAFADDMEPRIAAWRPGLGCTQLPIGARMDMVSHLPRMPDATRAPELDQQPWPM